MLARFCHLVNLHKCCAAHCHTLLVQNHMGWHCFQNASYTGDVCDLHLRLTAKLHISLICDVFNTKVNTSLTLCSTYIYGGIAILWRKSLGSACKPVLFDGENRLIGLEVSLQGEQFLLINVYLPCCSNGNSISTYHLLMEL